MTGRRFAVTLGRPLGATLLFGLLLLVALSAVAVGWADLAAATAERDAKADLLAHAVAVGRRGAGAPEAAAPDPFVVAETQTLAAAQIEADVRALAVTAGLSLRASRAEVKPPETTAAPEAWTRLTVEASLEGQNDALQDFLAKLETGRPVAVVDSLAIEPAETEGAATDAQAPRLHASLTLTAFWRPPARQAAR